MDSIVLYTCLSYSFVHINGSWVQPFNLLLGRMKAAQDGQKASNRTKEDTAYLVQVCHLTFLSIFLFSFAHNFSTRYPILHYLGCLVLTFPLITDIGLVGE